MKEIPLLNVVQLEVKDAKQYKRLWATVRSNFTQGNDLMWTKVVSIVLAAAPMYSEDW